jgi:hypothetical protein
MLRVWLATGVGIVALVLSGVVATLAAAQAGADPAAVVAAYEMARNQRDIDGALSFFADDATVSQRSTNFAGKDEIRKFLDSVSVRSRFVVVSERRTSGNRVTWTERSGGQGPGPGSQSQLNGPLSAPLAYQVNVEATVQDGKIRTLTYLPTAQPVRFDPALDGRAQLPASLGLAGVFAILLSVVMITSTGLRRPAREASSLQGRLMHDLQGWSAARQ